MASETVPHYLSGLMTTIARGFLLTVVLPLVPALLFTIPVPTALALISATLIIEYGAAPIGLGLGLPAAFVLYVLCCVALGVILTLYDIFDLLGERSERVSRFLKKSSERAGRSVFLKKYGIYGLVPGVMTLGFYVCPPVSRVLGWPRSRSIVLIMAGYVTISLLTMLASGGLFQKSIY